MVFQCHSNSVIVMKKTSFLFIFILTVLSINGFAADYGEYNIHVSYEYNIQKAKHLTKIKNTIHMVTVNTKDTSINSITTTIEDTYNDGKISHNVQRVSPKSVSNKNTFIMPIFFQSKAYGELSGNEIVWDGETYSIVDSLPLTPSRYTFSWKNYDETETNNWLLLLLPAVGFSRAEYQVRPIIEIRPKEINVDEEERKTIGTLLINDLLNDQEASYSIHATKGFPSTCYPWYYQIGNGTEKVLPSSCKSENGATIKPTGERYDTI